MVTMRGLIARLGLSRKFPTVQLRPEEVSELLFGQQHLGTQDFFLDRLGQYHTVELESFPHFQFLDHWLSKPLAADNPYLLYLEASWAYCYPNGKNTIERRRERVNRFISQYVKLRTATSSPAIRICQRPDGKRVILDGNHRASIACKLGRGVNAEVVPLTHHLAHITRIPGEFYGSKRFNKPYQSVYYRGQRLLEGRRTDLADRMNQLAEADIRNKTVLDLGCNVGMSCYLAAEKGASQVTGVEGSPRIATAAIRLNSVLAAPCRFIQHDLNKDFDVGRFDTVFCFSVVNHLKNKEAIVRTLDKAVGSVLYFEGHAETALNDYDYLLNKSRFSRIDLLGHTSDGIHTSSKSRPLWRCEV